MFIYEKVAYDVSRKGIDRSASALGIPYMRSSRQVFKCCEEDGRGQDVISLPQHNLHPRCRILST